MLGCGPTQTWPAWWQRGSCSSGFAVVAHLAPSPRYSQCQAVGSGSCGVVTRVFPHRWLGVVLGHFITHWSAMQV